MAEQLPIWQALGVEPPSSLVTNGWQPGMKPSAQHMNWLFNRIYKCLEEIQAGGGTEELEKELAALQQIIATHLADKEDPHNSKQQAIDWAKGFGLGTVSKVLTNVDLNTITTENGFYYITGSSTNKPLTTNGYLLTNAYAPGYTFQTFVSVSGVTYIRVQNNSIWSVWRRVLDESMKNVANGYVGLDANSKINPAQLPDATRLDLEYLKINYSNF